MRHRVPQEKGQPAKQREEERMVTMIVRRIPETLRREVKAAAAKEGKTMSNFIAETLQAAVERLEKKGGR